MLYLFVAVFIVLIIMNVFMFLVLRQMAISTGRQIEKDAVRLFAVYDGILEDRSRRLEELDTELLDKLDDLEAMEQRKESGGTQAPAGVACVVTGKYRDEGFANIYQQVKNQFQFDLEEILNRLGQAGQDKDSQALKGCMEGILEKFSFDTQYELSTLPIEDQASLMEEVLDPDEKLIYHSYGEMTGKQDVQSFLEWLKIQWRSLDTGMTVRMARSVDGLSADGMSVGGLSVDGLSAGGGVSFEQDPSLCEGFQIIQGNQLYDYSI